MNWMQSISKEIFNKNYMINDGDKDLESVLRSVAETIADNEKNKKEWTEIFFEEMLSGRLLPAGRILANARPDSKNKYYNNCYTIDIDDSMEEIYDSLKSDALISATGGGVGFNISKLRPKNSPTSKGGVSSGPISFLKVFNESAKIIQTGGFRRAAHIAILNVDHPDIEEFVTCKRGEQNNELTQFNISVGITDEFMNAVKYDLPWDLVFNGKVYKTIKAKELYESIMKNAYMHNEPGVFFLDRANRDNNAPDSFTIDRTNPCLVGETLVAVADGRNAVSIKQLADEGKDVPVYAKDSDGKTIIRMMRNPRVTGHNQEIYEVTLDDGSKLKCTGNHKILMRDGSYKEVKDLVEDDSVRVDTKWKTSFKEVFNADDFRGNDYWMYNDGFKNKMEHRLIYEQTTGQKIRKKDVIHHKDFDSLNNNIKNLELMSKEDHDAYHSNRIKGKNNPYHEMTDGWKFNFASMPREKNSKYSGYTNKDLLDIMVTWVKENKKPLTYNIWNEIAKSNGYPQSFSKMRGNKLNYIKKANILGGQLWLENQYHRREYERYTSLLEESDLELVFEDGSIYVIKRCEGCNKELKLLYRRREVCFCSDCSIERQYEKMSQTVKSQTEKRRENNIEKLDVEFSKYIYSKNTIPDYIEIKSLMNRLGFNDFRAVGLNNYKNYLNHVSENYSINIDYKKIKHGHIRYSEDRAKVLKENGLTYNHKVVSVKKIGYDTVYNGTVDDVHNFNIVVGKTTTASGKEKYIMVNNLQCGEISMPSWSLCCLSSINFTQFVKNSFTSKAYFDFDMLEKSIKIGVRFLDNVLDVTKYPLDKIEKFSKQWRRIGLGFTGFADMLAMLEIKYNSEEALKFTSQLAEKFRDTSYIASSELAKEKGPYPSFKLAEISKSGFFQKLPENIKSKIKNNGLRNVGINTIAPNGTISLSLGQNCSSGIEPIFSLDYNRKIRTGSGEETRTEKVYDYAWMLYQNKTIFERKCVDFPTPDYFVTTFDINPYEGVNIQAVWQNNIDHSISKTVNLPNGFSYEEYKNLFLYAFEKGLKGITTFNPEGSISGILSSDSKKIEARKIGENNAPPRPESLACDIHEISVNKERHIVLCGFLDGRLYEIFVTPDPEKKIDVGRYKQGFTRKVKKGVYELVVKNGEEKELIPNIGKAFDPVYGSLSRFISMSLRHGVSLQFIVDQLQKDTGFVSFERTVSRILKKYIKDGEISTHKCTECGGTLEYREGCLTCPSCGISKCG